MFQWIWPKESFWSNRSLREWEQGEREPNKSRQALSIDKINYLLSTRTVNSTVEALHSSTIAMISFLFAALREFGWKSLATFTSLLAQFR